MKLGITPVGLVYIGFFVMMGVAVGGTWLLKLVMMFFRWLES